MQTNATINGTEYGWVDVKVILPGSTSPVNGIMGISYSTMREKKNIKGRGGRVVARGRGSKDFEGSITLLQSEVIALERAAGSGKDLTDIAPFPVTVQYAIEGGPVVTDRLMYCEFGKYEKALKEGDMNMEIEVELIIGDIIAGI